MNVLTEVSVGLWLVDIAQRTDRCAFSRACRAAEVPPLALESCRGE